MIGGCTTIDPNAVKNLLPGHPNGLTNTSGRTLASPQTLTAGEVTWASFIWGQSNSDHPAVGSFYTPTNTAKLQNLSMDDGALYQAKDPMLNACNNGGSWSIQYGDAAITDAKCARHILASCGVGSSYAAEWQAGGVLNHRITALANRFKAKGLMSCDRKFAIRVQGESDTFAGTSGAAYSASLASEIATVQAVLPGVPIFIVLATLFNGSTSSTIRAAQSAAIDNVSVFSGGDFDTITGAINRTAGTDLTGPGVAAAAALVKATIYSYVASH